MECCLEPCPDICAGRLLFFSALTAESSPVACGYRMLGAGGRPWLPVGTVLEHEDGTPLFRVVANAQLPAPGALHAVKGSWALPLTNMAAVPRLALRPRKEGLSIAWVTLSDKGAAGERVDESGPLIERIAREALCVGHAQGYILPDSVAELKQMVMDLALLQGYDVVFTTGGTGIGPRDTTPEALTGILEKRLHGFEQAMMAASLQKTPNAVISRAVAGTLGGCLILTLPGSRKAVAENLEAVLPAVAHAVAKLQGDKADCGG